MFAHTQKFLEFVKQWQAMRDTEPLANILWILFDHPDMDKASIMAEMERIYTRKPLAKD